ncbi:protein kinase domain-containing protein [Alkalinema pantanalense CENA528]
MAYCFNPRCSHPENLDRVALTQSLSHQSLSHQSLSHQSLSDSVGMQFCAHCGQSLCLRDRYFGVKRLGQSTRHQTILARDRRIHQTVLPHQSSSVVVQVVFRSAASIALYRALQVLTQKPDSRIPPLLDVWTMEENLYLVWQYVVADNLVAVVYDRGLFTEPQIWLFLRQLLAILQPLHRSGILHRHIQPSHLLQSAEGQYYLIGWQSIQPINAVEDPATLESANAQLQATTVEEINLELVGSAEYAAPEQLQGRATAASDLYSLGVTCLYLLTGLSPFALWDDGAQNWRWEAVVPEAVSGQLQSLLDRLITPNITDRFTSVDQVLQAMGEPQAPAFPGQRFAPSPWAHQRTLTGHRGGVTALLWDGSRSQLFSAGQDQTIRMWDLQRSEPVDKLIGHRKTVSALALTPDHPWLTSASYDKTLRVWDLQTKTCVREWNAHDQIITGLVDIPNSNQIISSSWDKTLRRWNWETGELLQTITGHRLPISAIAVSPNQQWLASASHDRTVRIWELATLKLHQELEGHTWAVTTVAFSPDGQWLATGSDDRTIKIWQVDNGKLLKTLPGHGWSIAALAFSPDGQWLASGSWMPAVRLWQWQQETVFELQEFGEGIHRNFVHTIVFTEDDRLITGSQDQRIRVHSKIEREA